MAGFFDNIGKKVTQVGQGALKKTQTMADSSALKNKIEEEKNRYNAYIQQLGAHYYATYGEQPHDERAKLLMNSIRECVERNAQYNEQLQRVLGVIRCEQCGAEGSRGATFCNTCGNRLPVQEEKPAPPPPPPSFAPQPVPVPAQGAAPQPTAAPVYAPQPAPVYAPQPAPVYAPQPAPVYAPQPAPVYAPQPTPVYTEQPSAAPGYAPSEPETVYEPQPAPIPAPVSEDTPAPAAASFCGECGQPMEPGAMFCGFCGAKSPDGGM